MIRQVVLERADGQVVIQRLKSLCHTPSGSHTDWEGEIKRGALSDPLHVAEDEDEQSPEEDGDDSRPDEDHDLHAGLVTRALTRGKMVRTRLIIRR